MSHVLQPQYQQQDDQSNQQALQVKELEDARQEVHLFGQLTQFRNPMRQSAVGLQKWELWDTVKVNDIKTVVLAC